MYMNKSRRICFITGSGSGIGLATAIEMAKRGFDLICVGRNMDKLDTAKYEIKKHGINADIFALDVSSREMVFKMVALSFWVSKFESKLVPFFIRATGLKRSTPKKI